MNSYKIELKQIEELIEIFERHLQNAELPQAQEIFKQVENLRNFLSIRFQKTLNENLKWIFLDKDTHLEDINISKKIKDFLENLKSQYWEYIIDEITILKLTNNSNAKAVYIYSIDTNKIIEDCINPESIENTQKALTKDLHFFIENVVKKWWLEDWEGTLAWNQTWNSYDIILRIWDYLIWFNNSNESIDSLNNKLWIDMETLIHKVSEFYKEFKK